MDNYYTSGQFARKANVTLRTIRFYDKKDILKPSFRNNNGNRYYTDEDLVKLQQILLLKYLGFSLDEIREITLGSGDWHILQESLSIQKKLVQERIGELQSVLNAIDNTSAAIEKDQDINWNHMMDLIHLTAIERSLKSQYLNASNISARISLHRDYSVNPEGWFHWVMKQCDLKEGMRVLEVGCGSGALWTDNLDRLPTDLSVTLTDISEGMVNDVKRAIGNDNRFQFATADCHALPFEGHSFDLIIANHVLFYSKDINIVLAELHRVLKSGGRLIASTYGKAHMKEITELVQAFSPDIHLSMENLYDTFGLENGESLLKGYFRGIELKRYEDAIELSEAAPLILYILSCHGNQNHILKDRYREFSDYVTERVKDGFHITKDAGLFICKN